MTYLDEESGQKQQMQRMGPRLTNCNTEKFDGRGFIKKTRVFFDSQQITGIAFGFQAGLIIERIGESHPNYMDFDFEEDDRLRGLFGASDGNFISELGFVVES